MKRVADEEARRRILAALDEEGAVTELQRLVRFPSVTGEEHGVSAYLAERLDEIGLAVECQEVTPGRNNVIGSLKGTVKGSSALLNGHMDVVPPGDGWTEDPFGGRLKDGYLWGRGSVDMKGGLAALMAAVQAMLHARIPFKGEVRLAVVVDEEESGSGMQRLLANGLRADCALVAEPTELNIVNTHKGLAAFAITTHGLAAHASVPEQGKSAIDEMRRVLDALDQYRSELEAHRHPLLGPPTLVVGTIRGGVASCIVPAACTIEVDRRLIPGEDATRVRWELEALCHSLGLIPTPEITLKVEARPLETPPVEPIVVALQRAVRHEGLADSCHGWPAVSDAHLLAGRGIPTVLYGPGDLQHWAHKPDERLSTADLATAARVYCHLLVELLT